MLLTPSAQRHEGDATAKQFRVRNGIDVGDASGNKDGGGLRSFPREGHGDVDEGGEWIGVFGLEAEAAAGHIDAGEISKYGARTIGVGRSDEVGECFKRELRGNWRRRFCLCAGRRRVKHSHGSCDGFWFLRGSYQLWFFFTDDADFGFAIGFERAENQFLLGNKFVTRQDAGTMETDDDGFGLFGEHRPRNRCR